MILKALQITYHSLFALLGSLILISPLVLIDLVPILTIVLFINGILILLVSAIKGFYFRYLSLHFFFLLLYGLYCYYFFTRNYYYIKQADLQDFLTITSTFLAYYFALHTIFRIQLKPNFRPIKTTSFKKYYLLNYFIILVAIGLFAAAYYFKGKDLSNISNYSIIILILSFPFFNISYIKAFTEDVKRLCQKSDLDITFNQFGKLAKLRNFVFIKDKFISSENYKITDADYKSTVKVLTIMQLCYQLSSLWNKKYTKLFVLEDYEKDQLKINIVEQNENGITVIDDDAVMYHFGNNSFIKEKIKRDETANLFLVKNGLPLAKFKISERIEDKKVELINNLDYFGNTILFNPGMKEDLCKDYSIVFDQIYSETTEKRQVELLDDLEQKAPTAYFGAKEHAIYKNSLTFYITTKAGVEKKENLIVCDSNNIQKVPSLIEVSKKVHTFLKYALSFSIIFQVALLWFSILSHQKLIIIAGIQLIITLIAELISIYFKKKINYLPGQPANLAQSHQAA